jgi:hypothetical protein
MQSHARSETRRFGRFRSWPPLGGVGNDLDEAGSGSAPGRFTQPLPPAIGAAIAAHYTGRRFVDKHAHATPRVRRRVRNAADGRVGVAQRPALRIRRTGQRVKSPAFVTVISHKKFHRRYPHHRRWEHKAVWARGFLRLRIASGGSFSTGSALKVNAASLAA